MSIYDSLDANPHHINRYLRFVNHYKSRESDGYTERHHIIPRSLGGDNSKDNLVNLPARAHYIAHMMLWKALPSCNAMTFAAHMMRSRTGRSSHLYASLTEAHSRACSQRSFSHTEETKARMSATAKSQYRDWLLTDEARNRSRIHASTILQTDAVIEKRASTLRLHGEHHASKRSETKRKIGLANQSIRLDAVDPTGAIHHNIYMSEFCAEFGITRHVIRKFLDQGPVPPVTNKGLLSRIINVS